MKALAKKPEERFESAAEFASALKRVAGGEVVTGAMRALPPSEPSAQPHPSVSSQAPTPDLPFAQPPAYTTPPPRSSTPWLVLGLGALLALIGTGALVLAILMR